MIIYHELEIKITNNSFILYAQGRKHKGDLCEQLE